jgi:hypothetical protein
MEEIMDERPQQEMTREVYRGESLNMAESKMEKEYKPSRQEILRDYEISLRFLSGRGMLIRVGCKEIAFEDSNKGMEELTKYIQNPHEEGKRWTKIFNEQ